MKKLAKILLGIIAIILTLVLIILVPAHIQTRRINPTLPSIETVAALQNNLNGPISLSYVLTASQMTSKGLLGHPVFVAQWADGRIFLIDAGMDKEGAEKFATLIKKISKGKDARFFGTVHDFLGDAAPRITGIGFTHLHVDHTQGVDAFCAARAKNGEPSVHAYLTDLQKSKHNFNTKAGAKLIQNSCLKNGLLADSNIINVDGFPGLSIVKLSGHTPGSTLFILNIDGHLWLLSGDIAASKTHLLGNHGKGFLYSYILVPENTTQTQKLRLWLSELDARDHISVLVSHDLTALKNSGLKPFQPSGLPPN